MEHLNYIFTFDLSSTACGWCIIYQHPESNLWTYHSSGTFVFNKRLDLLHRAHQFEHLFLTLQSSLRHSFGLPLTSAPQAVYIEAPKVGFTIGSSASVRALLQGFNSICQYIVFDHCGIQSTLVSEATVRKGLISAKDRKEQKQQVGKYFAESVWWFPEDKVQTDRNGKYTKHFLDETDACCIALWVMKQENKE